MPAAPSLLSTRAIPPRERLIAALDVPEADEARRLVRTFGDAVHFYKLGFELMASGQYFELVDELAGAGKKLFLDLKLYDIPETVGRAVRSPLRTRCSSSASTFGCTGSRTPSRRNSKSASSNSKSAKR